MELIEHSEKLAKHLKLTERQIVILKLLGAGLTEEAVAHQMSLSINTIKYHKKQILRGLNSSCTLEAVIKALRFNLFSIDSLRGGLC
jgi:DNA-binding NarL/FixJ family response regulator